MPAPIKPPVYRFRRRKGIALMLDLRDMMSFLSKLLGFKISVDGLDIQETVDGIHLTGKAGGGTDVSCSWSGEVVGSSFQFLSGGLVNGTSPDNMEAEDGLWSGPIGSGVTYIKLAISASNNVITGIHLVSSSLPADPVGASVDHAPDDFEINLWVVIAGVPYRIASCGSFSAQPIVVQVVSSGEACGSDPYRRYYTWQIL